MIYDSLHIFDVHLSFYIKEREVQGPIIRRKPALLIEYSIKQEKEKKIRFFFNLVCLVVVYIYKQNDERASGAIAGRRKKR